LKDWEKVSRQFVKVMPVDYKKALLAQKDAAAQPVAVA
jgi:glutamate synthase domain-containing protein 3